MSAIDLSTRYLGLELRNPLIASSSPLTGRLDSLMALEDAGAAAAVLPSLFEEQIVHEEVQLDRLHETGAFSVAEAGHYFPELQDYNTGPDGYLRHLEAAREALSIPVIGSLNGASAGGWLRYARMMQDAGASALELNVYFVPTDPDLDAARVEQRYLDVVAAVCAEVSIPVAVKLGSHFSAPANLVRRLVEAGAAGVVLFNRFLEPDLDLEALEVVPRLELSRSAESRLPLRWIAILSGAVSGSLGATSGAHQAGDVLKLLLAGADAVLLASSLLLHGPGHLTQLLGELQVWLEEKEYRSVEQLKGSLSRRHAPDPGAYERSNYMRALLSYSSDRP